MKMKLTKNEKKTLKLLLENSRTTDSEISSMLKISSQAVGKIRRKLESSVIESYTMNLNYAKLGIQIFALTIARLTREGQDKGELEVEQALLSNPHIISVYRIPKLSSTHIIFYGFRDMNELDKFFHSPQIRQFLHNFIETQELFTFSHNSLIKNNPVQLLQHAIDNFDNEPTEQEFSEIRRFKKKLTEKNWKHRTLKLYES